MTHWRKKSRYDFAPGRVRIVAAGALASSPAHLEAQWMLLPDDPVSVSDILRCVANSFELSSTDNLELRLDGALLRPEQPADLVRDGDTLTVIQLPHGNRKSSHIRASLSSFQDSSSEDSSSSSDSENSEKLSKNPDSSSSSPTSSPSRSDGRGGEEGKVVDRRRTVASIPRANSEALSTPSHQRRLSVPVGSKRHLSDTKRKNRNRRNRRREKRRRLELNGARHAAESSGDQTRRHGTSSRKHEVESNRKSTPLISEKADDSNNLVSHDNAVMKPVVQPHNSTLPVEKIDLSEKPSSGDDIIRFENSKMDPADMNPTIQSLEPRRDLAVREIGVAREAPPEDPQSAVPPLETVERSESTVTPARLGRMSSVAAMFEQLKRKEQALKDAEQAGKEPNVFSQSLSANSNGPPKIATKEKIKSHPGHPHLNEEQSNKSIMVQSPAEAKVLPSQGQVITADFISLLKLSLAKYQLLQLRCSIRVVSARMHSSRFVSDGFAVIVRPDTQLRAILIHESADRSAIEGILAAGGYYTKKPPTDYPLALSVAALHSITIPDEQSVSVRTLSESRKRVESRFSKIVGGEDCPAIAVRQAKTPNSRASVVTPTSIVLADSESGLSVPKLAAFKKSTWPSEQSHLTASLTKCLYLIRNKLESRRK